MYKPYYNITLLRELSSATKDLQIYTTNTWDGLTKSIWFSCKPCRTLWKLRITLKILNKYFNINYRQKKRPKKTEVESIAPFVSPTVTAGAKYINMINGCDTYSIVCQYIIALSTCMCFSSVTSRWAVILLKWLRRIHVTSELAGSSPALQFMFQRNKLWLPRPL